MQRPIMTNDKAIERMGELKVLQQEYINKIETIEKYIVRLRRLLSEDLSCEEEYEVLDDRKYLDAEIQQFIYR